MSRKPSSARQPTDPGAAAPQGSERQPRHGGEVQFPSALRMTITLLDTAARTELEIAETLRDMAAQARGETAARRLKLARDAMQGAQEAESRGKRLQELGRQWADHAEVAKLHRLLGEATQVLTGLAQTQQGIAEAFAALANQDSSALATQRRELAAAATANARDARNQAQYLHELAATSAAGHRSPPRHRYE